MLEHPPSPDKLFLGWVHPKPRVLGFDKSKQILSEELEPLMYTGDRHLCTVAPTRSGKGRGVLIPNLLHYTGPAVVFDPKGELYEITHKQRERLGQKVYRLDPFGVVDDHTDALDPFDIFALRGADVESDAQMLAEMLSTGNKGIKDPFWDLSACGIISGVIAYVAALLKGPDRTFPKVAETLTSDDVSYNLAVVLDTVGEDIPRLAYREIASFLQLPDRETRPSVLGTANSYLKAILSEKVARSMRKSTFSLEEIVNGDPITVYIMVPPDKLVSHKALLKIWVGVMLKAITSRRSIPEKKTVFFLDECAQLGNFPFLENIITLCAGYGVLCWMFWQDLNQLSNAYPTSWQTILNNCGVLQAFGFNNRNLSEQWSAYLDHPPSELRRMDALDQIVQIYGGKEYLSRRGDYLKDTLFAGKFDRASLAPNTPLDAESDGEEPERGR
ncbi:MAG: type IV secretory system conjugative DNA transfer family protein [Zavarzinella sp.]